MPYSKTSKFERELFSEFMRRLTNVVPSVEVLERDLMRFSSSIELSRSELNQVLYSLERVYYILLLMRELQEYFKDKIQFGGGVVLNYIFMLRIDVPRFTFDLDSSWNLRVNSKRSVLGEIVSFNKYLAEKYSLCLPISSDKCVELMIVEYDIEKDYFPQILSLRLPVITRWSGLEFYKYVKTNTSLELEYSTLRKLRECFKNVLGVRDAKIDYIRFEITLKPIYPCVKLDVELPFNLGYAKLNITELEYQLASKLVYKIGWDFREKLRDNLHDVLKAVLDMRLLNIASKYKFREYVEKLSSSIGFKIIDIRGNMKRNLVELLRVGEEFWTGFHYILIRAKYRDISSLVRSIRRNLEESLL